MASASHAAFSLGGVFLNRRWHALGLVPTLLWLSLSWRHRAHETEDGLIYLRYVANALAGHGLVFNPSEFVNGLTSPLYGYLVWAVAVFCGDVAVAALLVSALAVAVCALMLSALFERAMPTAHVSHRFVAPLLLVSSVYTYEIYGMEAWLFAAVVGLSILLYVKHRFTLLAVALAMTILTRPEGLFLIVAIAFDLLVFERRRLPKRLLGVPLAVLALQLLGNTLYYGAPLSASGVAKLGQGASGLWWNGNFVITTITHVDRFFAASWPAFAVLALLALVGLGSCRDARLRRSSMLFLALLTLFYTAFRIPSQDWYYAPFYFFAWLFVGCGWSECSERLRSAFQVGGWQRLATALSVLMFLLPTLTLVSSSWRGDRLESTQALREVGLWLGEHTPANARIAMCEIGAVGWYSQRNVVDILGLVRPANAASIARGNVYEWLERDSPEFILIHEPAWHLEAAVPQAEDRGEYREVEPFDFEGFRLLAKVQALQQPASAHDGD
jgi:arabinofuranosyltransferase